MKSLTIDESAPSILFGLTLCFETTKMNPLYRHLIVWCVLHKMNALYVHGVYVQCALCLCTRVQMFNVQCIENTHHMPCSLTVSLFSFCVPFLYSVCMQGLCKRREREFSINKSSSNLMCFDVLLFHLIASLHILQYHWGSCSFHYARSLDFVSCSFSFHTLTPNEIMSSRYTEIDFFIVVPLDWIIHISNRFKRSATATPIK